MALTWLVVLETICGLDAAPETEILMMLALPVSFWSTHVHVQVPSEPLAGVTVTFLRWNGVGTNEYRIERRVSAMVTPVLGLVV
ncbi:MAG: hypothetical protein IPM46_01230 [Flavobacteriales bacterium]|nr:hypothetical protein [Flavobacteriales bacterium]